MQFQNRSRILIIVCQFHCIDEQQRTLLILQSREVVNLAFVEAVCGIAANQYNGVVVWRTFSRCPASSLTINIISYTEKTGDVEKSTWT